MLYQDFSLIRFWCCLIFISVSLLPFSFVNFSQNSLFPFFKYLLFQEIFSLLLVFSWYYGDIFQIIALVFCFLKIGIAPLAFWLEKIILEIKEGVFWLLTLPKIGPSFLLFSFSNSLSIILIFFFILISFSKLISVKNFIIILLYLGNFSVFFGLFLRILSFLKRIFWFTIYIIINYIILIYLENQSPDIFFFLILSPLPPMPFFFIKLYLFCFINFFSRIYLIVILVFSIILFYCIWEISRTFLHFKNDFFFMKKLNIINCLFLCSLSLITFLFF